MNKVLLSLFLSLIFVLTAYAENFPNIKYKNIPNKGKITYDSSTDTWSKKIDKKSGNYFVKVKGFGDFYDYNDSNGNFAFSTNCEYEFITNNNLICYSNRDMKFYYITYSNGGVGKRELQSEEVKKLFPEYKIIYLSDFSKNTNALKIKKHLKSLNILLLNDSDKYYDNYKFSSGNAKYEQYSLRGFLKVFKPGMIQFSGNETNSESPMYVLLIR